jgi:hypothetical protein
LRAGMKQGWGLGLERGFAMRFERRAILMLGFELSLEFFYQELEPAHFMFQF